MDATEETEDSSFERTEVLAKYLTEQIGTLPETEPALERMHAAGIDTITAHQRLGVAAVPFVGEAPDGTPRLDRDGCGAAFAAMPIVRTQDAMQALLDVVRQRRAVFGDRLLEFVAKRLAIDPANPVSEFIVEEVEADALEDATSAVTLLAPDILVHVPTLVGGIVLTHRLSETERAEGYLVLDSDLAGFLRHPAPRVASGVVEVDDPGGEQPVVWEGPDGWLDAFEPDTLLAVRVDGGELSIEVLDTDPAAPDELVATLRKAYDAETEADPDSEGRDDGAGRLPVPAELLLISMLYRDPSAFGEPQLPLTELAAAAGLELRGAEFGHDAAVWVQAAAVDRQHRLEHELESLDDVATALLALDEIEDADPAVVRGALDRLQEPLILVAVTEELLLAHEPAGVATLAERLIAVAGTGRRAAVAAWIAARAAERDGRVLDAESHLRAASRFGDGWPFVEDQLARYEFDRGDAAAALGRWQSIEVPADDPDVEVAALFASATGPEPGRNEPCWCGSGRKFKQCHLGRAGTATLQQRTSWLYRKAAGYLEQLGGGADDAMADYAAAAGLGDDIDTAYVLPLVVDVALAEGGWFAAFLTARGPLLPEDEAELAALWLKAERSVFEVVEAGSVRNLRTTEIAAVPLLDLATGTLLCGRLLPDGVGVFFATGASFVVPAEQRDEVLELLTQPLGFALLEWVTAKAFAES
ncbi:YecA family protein [Pseudonocardia sp. GCM10023141]|uniref:YecA family protein n=1 Tax=Pseudonocardia sp. GCM10023141 TaxID=3252653 RepID=UPI0036179463